MDAAGSDCRSGRRRRDADRGGRCCRVDRLARPGAARRAAGVLDCRGGSRRPAAATLRHHARPLASAGARRRRRSPLSRIADRLRGQAVSRACRRRCLRLDTGDRADLRPWPHRIRRFDPHHAGGAVAGAARRAVARRKAAPDGARRRDRAPSHQGRSAHALPQHGALWRQSRRHSCRRARLFRQRAEAAHSRRGGIAGGAAAVAGGATTRPLHRNRTARARSRPRPGGGSRHLRPGGDHPGEGRAGAGGPHAHAFARPPCGRRSGCGLARPVPDPPHHRWALAGKPRGTRARAGPRARAEHLGRDPRRRSCDGRGARPRRLRGLFRRPAGRPGRYDERAAFPGLDAQAVHLWVRLRGRPDPSGDADRRSPRALRRLCAGEFRSDLPGYGDGPQGAADVVERAGGRGAGQGRGGPLHGAAAPGRRSAGPSQGRNSRARHGPGRRRGAAFRSGAALCRAGAARNHGAAHRALQRGRCRQAATRPDRTPQGYRTPQG